jgi:hypothetical protein
MPWWVWIGNVALIAWAIVQLWRAKTRGKISGGVADFTRSSDPIAFWFQVGLNLLVIILFGGGALLVAAHAGGLIPN